MDVARRGGATIFHLCYGCAVPLDERNDDAPIREAAAAIPHCVAPKVGMDRAGFLFSSGEHVLVRPWPFTRRAEGGGKSIWDECRLMTERKLRFVRHEECPESERAPEDNPVRTRESDRVMHPAMSVHAQDVVTDLSDWTFRVLRHRGIDTIVYIGIDANECVLFSRSLSVLNVMDSGWPADHLFVAPRACDSNFDVHGVRVPWETMGAALWSAALFQNFGIRSICLDGSNATVPCG